MALSYSGVRLAILPAEFREWLEHHHALDDFRYSDMDWSDFGLEHLPIPQWPTWEEVEVGSLYWPTGASRCAFLVGVVDSAGLDAIRTSLSGSAGPAPLLMTSKQSGSSRTFPLFALPFRPLAQKPNSNKQCFLLPLCDQRWFLREKTGSITSTPGSWSALLANLASQLGITLTTDTIHADYGVPSARWLLNEKPLAPVLDAVCNVIGHRLVANLDGTFSTVTAQTASASQTLLVANRSKLAGGQLVQADLIRSAPAAVKVVFRDQSGGSPHTVTTTLGSLSLPAYGAATGVSGFTHTIIADLVYDGSNAAACNAYATEAAIDHYLWRLTDLDVTYPAVAEWAPTGAEDRIIWKYFNDRILTRVVRAPFQSMLGGATTISTDTDVTFGCNLTVDAGEVSVDVESLAGDGLSVNSDDDCDKLQVNYGCGLELGDDGELQVDGGTLAGDGLTGSDDCTLNVATGCGLTIDGDGAVALDLSAVAFDGLYWNSEICALGVNFGCGLTLVGDELTVDNEALAGDNEVTSLLPYGSCGIIFDAGADSNVDHTYVQDVTFTPDYCAGTLTLSKTRVTMTDVYNAAGVLVRTDYADPVLTDTVVDLCKFISCCAADPIDIVASADPEYGEAPLLVSFTADVTGGVGPYTYNWDFGDETSSNLQNPTHNYTDAGGYYVTLTVTDQCCSYTETLFIGVAEYCECEECLTGTAPVFNFTLENGTGDFANANGDWIAYKGEGCMWYAINTTHPEWRAEISAIDLKLELYVHDATHFIQYQTDAGLSCCDDFLSVNLVDSGGTGVEPDFTVDGITALTCEECLPEGTIATDCCEELLPATLYLNFTGASANLTCLNGLKIAMPYTGSSSTGWNNSGVGPAPCTGGAQIAVAVCLGSNWQVNYGAPGGCNGAAIVAAGDCSSNVIASGVMTFGVGSCGTGDGSGTVNFSITQL